MSREALQPNEAERVMAGAIDELLDGFGVYDVLKANGYVVLDFSTRPALEAKVAEALKRHQGFVAITTLEAARIALDAIFGSEGEG